MPHVEMDDATHYLLRRGVAEIIGEAELVDGLAAARPLRLKQGFDPSRPNLHIGHAVGLRKLRQFQERGHRVVLVVGDWTAQIGDPSGRDQSRQPLSAAEVKRNAQTYMEQFFRIVDESRTEVRCQSEWYNAFSLGDVFALTARFTLADMLAHETFRARFEKQQPLSLMELMYPLLQAYDSVAINADVEVGGTDQKFNILAGRELQAMLGQKPQTVLLVPLIVGTDGRKMSKSFGNTVDVIDVPADMYGKIMSMRDDVLPFYFETLTDVPDRDLIAMQLDIQLGRLNPRDAKMRLARDVVAMLHGPAAAQAAEDAFVRVFQQRDAPADMATARIAPGASVADFLVDAGLAASKNAARRLVQQGGVTVDGVRLTDAAAAARPGVWRAGPRRFVRAA